MFEHSQRRRFFVPMEIGKAAFGPYERARLCVSLKGSASDPLPEKACRCVIRSFATPNAHRWMFLYNQTAPLFPPRR